MYVNTLINLEESNISYHVLEDVYNKYKYQILLCALPLPLLDSYLLISRKVKLSVSNILATVPLVLITHN